MRIVDIRECTVPVKSDMRNSSFDFSEMTTSVVAVITDVVRERRPVVGFAFNSTGRYACGAAMRARFIPRILNADPSFLLDDTQENFDPAKILAATMQRENPAGTASAQSGSGRSRSRSGTPSPRLPENRSITCWPSATTAARSRAKCFAMSAAAGMRRGRP